MVTIHVVYQGGLHTEATHGPSKTTLATDAPVDNQGRGESFSPTDLVAGRRSAPACSRRWDRGRSATAWPLEGASCTVVKHMVADPERRIGKLVVTWHMPRASTSGRARSSSAPRSPARCTRASTRRVEIPVTFHWGES
jgi:putative redox protein